jgi:membrane protease YdiL (CAAX protease family)
MMAFICKHPAWSYFSLAFALSWIGVGAIIAPGAIPAAPADAERVFPMVYLAMLTGPSIAGILLTALTAGREGLRAYRRRLCQWRVPLKWYAIALGTAPVVLLSTVAALSVISSEFVPAIWQHDAAAIGPVHSGGFASFLLLGLSVGLGAGFFEELGWTGFAIPTLRSSHSVFRTGLTVGLLWGAWHGLAVYWGSANAFGSVPIPAFMLVALFTFLPPYRVLMVRVYERTQSLFVGILMHASLTASMILLGPAVTGRALVLYDLAFGAALWSVVALPGRGQGA